MDTVNPITTPHTSGHSHNRPVRLVLYALSPRSPVPQVIGMTSYTCGGGSPSTPVLAFQVATVWTFDLAQLILYTATSEANAHVSIHYVLH